MTYTRNTAIDSLITNIKDLIEQQNEMIEFGIFDWIDILDRKIFDSKYRLEYLNNFFNE